MDNIMIAAIDLKLYVLITDAIRIFFQLYSVLVLIRVVLSWVPNVPNNRIVGFVYDLTDPYLGFIERFLPPFLRMPINWSPVIALFLLSFIETLLLRLAFYILL